MEKIRLGISSGDINGVGLEVVIKTLSDARMLDHCTPVIYGSAKVVSYHKNIVKPDDFSYQSLSSAQHLKRDRINVVNCWNEDITITLGEPNEDSGKFAYVALDKAVQDLRDGLIDVLVTAPIDKHAMSLAGFHHEGHTEFLTDRFDAKDSLMLMVNDDLRIGVATNHVPIAQISEVLTKDLVRRKILILHKTLREDFGIEKPLIAVLGLNPHAGDAGLLGTEEDEIIRPAIKELKKKGILLGGPYSADGFFGTGEQKKVDAILAMYHDQGLIPFKLLSFGQGVNFTAGLSIIRTSPDHGTGVSLAGLNQADESSFRRAIFLALDLYRHRRDHQMAHKEPLHKKNLHEGAEDEIIAEDLAEDG